MNELRTWLDSTPHWLSYLVIAGVILLGTTFVGIVGAIAGYLIIGFTEPFASLLISAFGAFSTVLLVTVTFVTFLENQRLTIKRRSQPLIREEIREVILPSIAILTENVATIKNHPIDWNHLDIEYHRKSSGFGMSSLEPLTKRATADEVVFNRFFSKHLDIEDSMEKHDEMLTDLSSRAKLLVKLLETPLQKYIKAHNLRIDSQYDDPEYADAEHIAVFVIDEEDELDSSHSHQKIWGKHRDEFQQIAKQATNEEYEDFLSLKKEYARFADDLETRLEALRGELQQEYHISLYASDGDANSMLEDV